MAGLVVVAHMSGVRTYARPAHVALGNIRREFDNPPDYDSNSVIRPDYDASSAVPRYPPDRPSSTCPAPRPDAEWRRELKSAVIESGRRGDLGVSRQRTHTSPDPMEASYRY